jgi:hypothetical protein
MPVNTPSQNFNLFTNMSFTQDQLVELVPANPNRIKLLFATISAGLDVSLWLKSGSTYAPIWYAPFGGANQFFQLDNWVGAVYCKCIGAAGDGNFYATELF